MSVELSPVSGFLQQLGTSRKESQQHRILARWLIEDCDGKSLSLFAVRNSDSFYNKQWLQQIRVFDSTSRFAKNLLEKAEQRPWEPIPDLTFDDFEHPRCSLCLTAKSIRKRVQENARELLHQFLEEESPSEGWNSQLARTFRLFDSCKDLSNGDMQTLGLATLACSRKIKEAGGSEQHGAVVMWLVKCYKVAGVTSSVIKDLAIQLKSFNPSSRYADFFCRYMERHPNRPPLGLAFENVDHRNCDFCKLAENAWNGAEEAFRELLLPAPIVKDFI